jgi:hypothetical protein
MRTGLNGYLEVDAIADFRRDPLEDRPLRADRSEG